MNKIVVIAVSAVILSCVIASHVTEDLLLTGRELPGNRKQVRNAFGRGLKDSSDRQAVNWTWATWTIGGPTCLDKRNLTAVDIPEDTLNEMRESVSTILHKHSAVFQDKLAFGVGIVYNGKTIFSNFSGVISLSSTEKPTEDTVLSVGSNTKIMTSLLMYYLSEQGALKLSDPVTKYFNDDDKPAFKVVNPYDSVAGASGVKLESLADHTSGLPHDISCRLSPECTEEISINLTNALPLFRQPRTHPSYCNIGFALLGHCCERAARKFYKNDTLKYEDLLADLNFKSFGMTSTGFNYSEVKDRMATGYSVSDKKIIVDPSFGQDLNWYNPTGGMYSTTKDMLSYASHLLAKDALLSPSGFESFFLPSVDLPDGVSSFGRAGWETVYSNGFRTLVKGGLYGGFNCDLVLIPELKLGIFGWINLFSDYASDLTADVANYIVPTLSKYVEEHQPKQDIPDLIEEILGNYGYQGVTYVTILENANSNETGVYVGSVEGTAVWYVYDKKTTEAYNKEKVVFFRSFQMPAQGLDSCLMFTELGIDDGLLMFQFAGSNWYVTPADDSLTYEKIA